MGKAARKRNQVCEETTAKNSKQPTAKTGLRWSLLAVAFLLAGVATVFALNIPGLSKSQKVKPVNGLVTVPVAKVSDGSAHFYRISDGGKEIGFFIVKGSDGQLHTAFDSCDVCFRDKKGYVQDGDSMLCKNCGKKFLVNRIGPHSVGGCNPAYLPGTNDGRNVTFKIEDLKQGARYF
ncbi:DUF2318 domain-containing protein [Geobacter sp. DSM 9736]|uniref:DUF2318 domain-containing protein n=1 Tax=Geobacter sp. DSM 9736 TaxID=1277350 RepID=UPI000B4FDE03|nr:DUF2318 domain-containing protein [Geobacter sp. DSM 9736]SNB45391.1 Predicted membrane protein [Geobacter sp. DSM 9736]